MRTVLILTLALSCCPLEASEPQKPIPILLDTDIGDDIDDAFAVALALVSPELEVRGITTVFGDAHTRGLIVCRWLHAMDRKDIPVAAGKSSQPMPTLDGQFQYGLRPSNRQRLVRELAPQFLYQQLKVRPGELTLVAVGPLTNIADLIMTYPDCKPWIKRLVIMGGSVRVGYDGKMQPDVEWNIKCDIKAAQTVFAAGLPLVVAPLDATGILKLDESARNKVFHTSRIMNQELYSLYQLWEHATPVLFDPVAVALCFTERFCKMEDLHLTVDDKGFTRIGTGKPNARVATSVARDDFLKWYVERLSAGVKEPLSHKIPFTNRAQPVDRGLFPSRVHVIEDYETDIERRWWLCGKAEKGILPPGSKRSCRGVWTNDFDDRMGDRKARYTAVIFNPVPGPPMGPYTRLAFRCRLTGSSSLRVQIYSLSKGYHRHLTLTDLPQDNWLSLAVDMTQARRPDGSGGPLAEDERIDDLQFYTDAEALLCIDDIVLYDAAQPGENRPFPSRPVYTAWFDTGKQGKEWPGTFEIISKIAPQTWKAARSVPTPDGKESWIRLDLRAKRFVGQEPHTRTLVRFRYHVTGTDTIQVVLGGVAQHAKSKGLGWDEATVEFPHDVRSSRAAAQIEFRVMRGAELMVDDVLLFEK